MFKHAKPQYPPEEAFYLLDVSRGFGYDLLLSGELESYTIGRRRFVPAEAIDKFIEQHRRKSKKFRPVLVPSNKRRNSTARGGRS